MPHSTIGTQNASVGIITRTKNRPALLKRALESVLNQSYQNWRMVVVNDGGDVAQVDKLIAHYAAQVQGRIKVIHNEISLGRPAASNVGLTAIASDYVVLHDDDDSWASEFLTIAVMELQRAHAKHPRIKGIITKANLVFERLEGNIAVTDTVEPFMPWLQHGLVPLDLMLANNQFGCMQFLFIYDVIKEIGPFREDLPVLADWEFNIRFMRSYDIQIVPQYLAYYHHRRSELHGTYGNSVIANLDQHVYFRQFLQNEWLRNELDAGVSGYEGVGRLVSLSSLVQRQADAIVCAEQRIDRVDGVLDLVRNECAAIGRIEQRLRHLEQAITRSARPPFEFSELQLDFYLLGKLWLTSGRPGYYFKRFIESMANYGLTQTFRTVKFWLFLKGGRST